MRLVGGPEIAEELVTVFAKLGEVTEREPADSVFWGPCYRRTNGLSNGRATPLIDGRRCICVDGRIVGRIDAGFCAGCRAVRTKTGCDDSPSNSGGTAGTG